MLLLFTLLYFSDLSSSYCSRFIVTTIMISRFANFAGMLCVCICKHESDHVNCCMRFVMQRVGRSVLLFLLYSNSALCVCVFACGLHVCSLAVSLLRIPPLSGDYGQSPGLGLLRLHSTFRHDLKIYASDEGRVQMTAAAFAKVSRKLARNCAVR